MRNFICNNNFRQLHFKQKAFSIVFKISLLKNPERTDEVLVLGVDRQLNIQFSFYSKVAPLVSEVNKRREIQMVELISHSPCYMSIEIQQTVFVD